MQLSLRRGGDVLLLVAVGLLIALVLVVVQPVAGAVAVGAMAASIADPAAGWLTRVLRGRRRIASLLVALVATLAVAVPLGLVAYLSIVQLIDVTTSLGRAQTPVTGWLPRLATRTHVPLGTVEGLLAEGGRRLVPVAQALAAGSVTALIDLLLLAATIYALLADGRTWLRALGRIPPFDAATARLFLDEFRMVARSVLLGTWLTALLHGVAGFVAFAAVGLPRALLWGAVMTVASLIPGIGTALVWGPGAAVLAARGEWGRAVALVAWGVLVMGAIDYLARPVLSHGFGGSGTPRGGPPPALETGVAVRVEERTPSSHMRLPEYGVFVSMLGGVAALGVMGLFVGPLVVSLALVALSVMGRGTAGGGVQRQP